MVSPIHVEEQDIVVHEDFRVVAEASACQNLVAAPRMLARLLQIKNSFDVIFFELLHYAKFLD